MNFLGHHEVPSTATANRETIRRAGQTGWSWAGQQKSAGLAFEAKRVERDLLLNNKGLAL